MAPPKLIDRLKAWGKNPLPVLIGLAVIVALIWAYKAFWPETKPQGYQTAPPAAGMATASTHEVYIKPSVKAIDKKQAARKMDLPSTVIDNPDVEIISTATIKPSEGGSTTATTVNTQTGAVETIVKENPRPLFGFGGKTEIGIRAGISTRGQQGALYVRQDVLRIGGIHLAGYGEINGGTGNAEAKGMIDLSYRF